MPDGDRVDAVPVAPNVATTSAPRPTAARNAVRHQQPPRHQIDRQLERIIGRAGLKPWPKLFHNLRSTRQTELAERYPIHVVCAWLGNGRAVTHRHYLQVTDAHLESAAAEARAGPQATGAENENRSVVPSDLVRCEVVQSQPVTPTGFEPVSRP